MSVVATLRELSEVWKLFSDMPDDTTLSVDLAALYLGISVKTLARYRQNGDGPTYIQYQSEDSKARNQRVNYLLGDLRSWRDIHKVKSTMHAAQIRGLTFSTLNDFIKPQPFWCIFDKNRSRNEIEVVSHALTISDNDFMDTLLNPNIDVVWISVEKVIFHKWKDKNEWMIWYEMFTSTINNISLAAKAEQERLILNDALGYVNL
ncbi:hypothetical protein AB6N03_18080 [Klebsiella quasipneumoniae]|uniref:hypothetical protein n=1 Tax=Klebsiella quasipneumoniae TaxID=1463165 RepID=UPI0034E076BD|nr:hypothetical protein [Klebsiella quasipneumoniae subsp. quasipneumoniae]